MGRSKFSMTDVQYGHISCKNIETPPVWFTASALNPQMPPLQRLPGSSPRTLWTCSELAIKPFTPSIYSSVLWAFAPAFWPASDLWSGGIHSCYIVVLAPLLQAPDPATEPSAATTLTSTPLLPTTLVFLMSLMAHALSLGCRLGRGR